MIFPLTHADVIHHEVIDDNVLEIWDNVAFTICVWIYELYLSACSLDVWITWKWVKMEDDSFGYLTEKNYLRSGNVW